jgi:hypothetical protein
VLTLPKDRRRDPGNEVVDMKISQHCPRVGACDGAEKAFIRI